MLPIKDAMTQTRLPAVTLALAAATVLAAFALDAGGILYALVGASALWLAGPAVEDTLGRLRFAGLCAAGAGLAALAALALGDDDVAATAAAGVVTAALGGHLVLFPRGRMLTVVLVPLLFGVIELPSVPLLVLAAAGVALAGPGAACLAGAVAGLALARPLVDPERDRRGLPPQVPAY